jgi:hypothetical protein
MAQATVCLKELVKRDAGSRLAPGAGTVYEAIVKVLDPASSEPSPLPQPDALARRIEAARSEVARLRAAGPSAALQALELLRGLTLQFTRLQTNSAVVGTQLERCRSSLTQLLGL